MTTVWTVKIVVIFTMSIVMTIVTTQVVDGLHPADLDMTAAETADPTTHR